MKRLFVVFAVIIVAFMTSPLTFAEGIMSDEIKFNNPDFLRGMDISSVVSLERSGVRFSDGGEEDVFKILSDRGVNCIRVRVWNDPFDGNKNGYGGGNCDVSTACEIGRRAAACGMRLFVDFHYSDFWADPAKQKPPKAWEGLSLEEKSQRLSDFTYNSLKEIKSSGADICMVQIGNETNNALCGESDWESISSLMNAGVSAVRRFDKSVLVSVHFTDPQRTETVKWLADTLDRYKVDYDVFAVSYYPYWHGSLENLTAVLNYAAVKYDKYALVAETSYANTLEDTDGHPNTVSKGSNDADMPWVFTVQGQADAVGAVMNAVNEVDNKKGLGMFYWEGAWISVGDDLSRNKALWESLGSGWATSYSGGYDADAGRFCGGSAVDNQAFFDAQERALPSLDIFGMVVRSVTALDVNRDGRVNIRDATRIQKHIAGLTDLNSEELRAADVNGDKKVTVSDATDLQKKLCGILF